ncbi:MAG: hypothetical protein LBM02_10100 [Lachnospiraceae bacterium]|nr:hypothetical protein [Lachnospiraceae bacterium]
MAQKLFDKTLFRETSLFKWINCVELIEEDVIKCGKLEFKRCKSLMKSKKKLPKTLWSKYGSSIILVTTIDGEKEYKLISQVDYMNLLKRPNNDKFKGKWAIIYPDNYIYLPDSEVRMVNILMYTLDEKADDSSDCKDCSDCESYWDKEVSISDKVREVVIQETLKEIAMRIQIPKDENPNLDSNQKSATVN